MTEYEILCGRVGRQAADRAVALGDIDVARDAAQLDLRGSKESDNIVQSLVDFTFNGQKTVIESRHGIPFCFNEFWTARQRQAHSIHEVSYRACFKPQLPEFFISRLTAPGDRVYDPFMGRGTTPIQAALMGRSPVGNDINPLSVLLTRPRLRPPRLSEVSSRLASIDWLKVKATDNSDLLVFYHPETLGEIESLRSYLAGREAAGLLDHVDDWVRMVAINRLTGHSPGFFSVYSLPPNQAVSVESQRRINDKRKQSPPRRSVPDIILKKSKSLLSDATFANTLPNLFCVGPAQRTPDIPSKSIQLVVTSPPFLDIVQYSSDNWLRCWFANIDASSIKIEMHKKTLDWTSFVSETFHELARVLKPGGYVAFEVGEVRNGKIRLEELVIEAIDRRAFDIVAVMINVQDFTKTANCWGVANNDKGTNTNRIVLARKK